MTKIHITGNSGSGKSTFGKKLSIELGLPLFGLDKVVWKSGWKKATKEERRIGEEEIISGDEWIIEGVSSRALKAADIIVFLEVDLLTCLKRSFLRNIRYLFSGRPELPEGCPEIWVMAQQFFIIRYFHFTVGPSIREKLNGMDKTIHIVKNQMEYEATMSELCDRYKISIVIA